MRQKQQVRAPGSQAPRCTTWKSNEIKPLEVTENQGSRPPGRKPPSGPSPSPSAVGHAAQTFFGWKTKVLQSVPRAPEGYRPLGGRLCLHRTRDASPLLIPIWTQQNKTGVISRPVLGQVEGTRTRVGRVCALGIPGWFCA